MFIDFISGFWSVQSAVQDLGFSVVVPCHSSPRFLITAYIMGEMSSPLTTLLSMVAILLLLHTVATPRGQVLSF